MRPNSMKEREPTIRNSPDGPNKEEKKIRNKKEGKEKRGNSAYLVYAGSSCPPRNSTADDPLRKGMYRKR